MSMDRAREQARDVSGRTVVWIAPRAAHARDSAAQHAADAREWAAPRLAAALVAAREQGRTRVLPAMDNARMRAAAYGRDRVAPALSPRAQLVMENARRRYADDVRPRAVAAAVAARDASEPALAEARARAEAAAVALRGDVSAAEIRKLAKQKKRRKNRRIFMLALAIGAAAGWVWWQRKTEEPEWKADESLPPAPAPGMSPDAYRGEPVTDPGSVGTADDEGDETENLQDAAKSKHRRGHH